MTEGGRSRTWILPVAGVVLASAGAAVVIGHPLAAVAPAIAFTLAFAAWRAPLRLVAHILVFLVLVAESPQDRPSDGLWTSPLQHLGTLLLANYSATSGVSWLGFAGIDLIAALLLFRILLGHGEGGRTHPVATPLNVSLVVFVFAIAALEVNGVSRGGDASISYWQLRQILYLPLFAFILSQAFRGSDELPALGRTVVGAAILKAITGIAFYVFICLPRGLDPDYVTTHSDTVLFVLAMMVPWIAWLEEPRGAIFRRAVALSVLLIGVLHLNDRRIAWAGLIACIVLAVAIRPRSPARSWLIRRAVLALPLLVLYATAGWNSQAPAFQPVQALRSMADPEQDTSTKYREIENYNLVQTLARAPITGIGFGQPFDEVVDLPDITFFFPLYRYVPHNSVLWLLSVGGLFGFAALLLPIAVAVYLAARTYGFGRSALERTAALACLCALLLFLNQAWGDMGTQSWSIVLVVSLAWVVAGKLSVATGGWPVRSFVAAPRVALEGA